jgi:uncharacterized protein YdeI (YjbR/CyaY-like superfamily)
MAAVIPNPKRIHAFKTSNDFERWLSKHHDREPEIWLKIHKKASGLPTVTVAQALDVVLCWGWIDGLKKGFDERSFLQRYSPRTKRSTWSQVNQDHVVRLIEAGRMTPHGQLAIDAAKADGRWTAAYAPIRKASVDTVPDDLRGAIEQSPRANETFLTLNKQNLFALTFRTNNMKTAAGRARQIARLVAMLERGETISPNPPARKRAPTKKSAPKRAKPAAKPAKRTTKKS